MDESPFRADINHLDGSAMVRVAGELDLVTAPVLRRVIAGVVSPHLHAVTLDLGGLTFVDVVGLHALVDIREMAAASGADFRLVSVAERIVRAIRLAGFNELENATTV